MDVSAAIRAEARGVYRLLSSVRARLVLFFSPIRLKLLIAFLAVSLLPLTFIVGLNYSSLKAALTQSAYRSLHAAASRTAVSIDAFVGANLDVIGTEAKLPAFAEYLSLPPHARAQAETRRRILRILESLTNKDRAFISSYALLDITGRTVIDTRPSNVGVDFSNRDFFTIPLGTGIAYASPVEFSPNASAHLYFSCPVYDEARQPIGVLRSEFSAAVLQRWIVRNGGMLGPGSFAVLLDDNYLLLAQENASEIRYETVVPLPPARVAELQALGRLPPLAAERVQTAMRLSAEDLARADGPEPFFSVAQARRTSAAAVTRLNTKPWLVVAFQPQDAFLEPVRAHTRRTLLFALPLAAIVAAAAIGVASALSRRIARLTSAARKVADGDLTARADVGSADEIGTLGLAFNDMTAQLERREQALAEEKERLAVTLRSIGDGVITTDTEGRVVLVNAVAERLTGWSHAEARGEHIATVFHVVSEKTGEPHESPIDQVMQTGAIVDLAHHMTLVAKDGTRRVIADSAAPIRDAQSRIIGTVLVFRDVTEKQKLEAELLRIEKLESLGRLAGGIAHDFNNILAAIIGGISLMKLSDAPAEILTEVQAIEKAARRAAGLTRQLLTFSKGGAPIKKTTSLMEIIEDSARFALHGSGVKCAFSIPKDLLPVEVDHGQMSQVIHNLIVNAAEAMPDGGVIRVHVENVAIADGNPLPLAPGRYVKLAICDSGVGISEENLEKIFDPYFTTKPGGSGLGLTTAHSIVKKHGGHITLESKLGAGTTFHVYLPASQQEIKGGRSVKAALPMRKGRVLLMDDEESVRRVAGEMLRRIGYEVASAKDGIEAVQLYLEAMQSGKGFDAVIMDLTVPGGMGGKETVRRLQEIDRGVKAIVSSGYSSDPIMSDFRSYGFCGVVTKPYTVQELSQALEATLGASSLGDRAPSSSG